MTNHPKITVCVVNNLLKITYQLSQPNIYSHVKTIYNLHYMFITVILGGDLRIVIQDKNIHIYLV